MMQQMAMRPLGAAQSRPFVFGNVSRGVRWGALALASIAVPASMALMALAAAPVATAPIEIAPIASAAPVAPISVPAPEAPSTLPVAPADSIAPAAPAYSFVWTEECESSCPGRGDF